MHLENEDTTYKNSNIQTERSCLPVGKFICITENECAGPLKGQTIDAISPSGIDKLHLVHND
jgi:hypothetical protein